MNEALKRVDGSEIEVSIFDYSFEKTPFRESWFQTYTRQDQGDEILYYPEHKSFPIPYEMPMSTFTYGKSQISSKKASGQATPIEEESNDATPPTPEEPVIATPTRSTRAGNKTENTNNSTKKKNLRSGDPPQNLTVAALKSADKNSRKSPRGHASTKSLLGNYIFMIFFSIIFIFCHLSMLQLNHFWKDSFVYVQCFIKEFERDFYMTAV